MTQPKQNNEAWLSLVERCVRDAEVACSNHVASINRKMLEHQRFPAFFIFHSNLKFYSFPLCSNRPSNIFLMQTFPLLFLLFYGFPCQVAL